MAVRATNYQLSHWTVRAIAGANLINLGLSAVYPRYSHAIANGLLGKITDWSIVASLLLPFYVGLEFWWMRRTEVELKPLWIDAAFAGAFLLALLIGVAYSFAHYVPF